MLVKNAYDRQGLLAIGAIVADILDSLVTAARPGLTTNALDLLAARLLQEAGAEATPKKEYRFPGHLCISVNDEVVHGIPGNRVLEPGDLIKLDLTADKRGYVADATRMAVLEPAAASTLLLAETARKACHAAIASAKSGMSLKDLGQIIQGETARSGFTVIKELCGHGVGRHTHEEPEVPNYPDRSNAVILKEGMVIAIEPIITCGRASLVRAVDGWTMKTGDGAWVAHYEETVIIGPDGAEAITVAGRFQNDG